MHRMFNATVLHNWYIILYFIVEFSITFCEELQTCFL